MELHRRQKLCHFRCYVLKAKLFCLRNVHSSYPGWSVHTGKFSSGFPEIFVPTSGFNTWRLLRMEEWRGESQTGRPGLYEEVLKCLFNLSSQE